MGVDHNLVQLPPSCRSTMRPFRVPMSASETWIPPAWRGSAPRHPLLSHSTHLPTSTPSLSRWLVFACMPTRHGLPGAFSPMVLTTRGWSVSLTPSWSHDRPRKISTPLFHLRQCLVAAHRETTAFPRDKRRASTNGVALWAAQCCKDLQPYHTARRGFVRGFATTPLGVLLGAPCDHRDVLERRLRGGRWQLG
jgi:hypothetical protein